MTRRQRCLNFRGYVRQQFLFLQCEPIANQGFKRGSYRCICRRGYYFPHPNSDTKYFNGSEIEEEYDKKGHKETNLYDDEFKCLPCSEGCDECSDDSPCMYKVNLISRVVLISINTLAAILAIVSGLVVYIFRESEVILHRKMMNIYERIPSQLSSLSFNQLRYEKLMGDLHS